MRRDCSMRNREQIEKAREKAHAYEKRYSGCAQSVLGALQEEFGIGNEDSFKAASVLAGGIARQGETWGAIVGALCALGLVSGRGRIEDTETYKAAMDASVKRLLSELSELPNPPRGAMQFDIVSEVE